MSAVCWIVPDIRGDFDLLIHMFVHQAKVIRLVEDVEDGQKSEPLWEWIAPPNTCVVLLGNLIHCFGESNERKLTTLQAIQRERHILRFLASVEELALRNQGLVVTLLGTEEIGAMVDDPQVLKRGFHPHDYAQIEQHVQEPNHPIQEIIRARKAFIDEVLIPFAGHHGIIAQWAHYNLCNQGFEIEWLRMVNFQTIPELNQRFQFWVQSGQKSQLKKFFWDPSSPVRSQKMAMHPILWKEKDLPELDMLLRGGVTPKYVASGPPIQDVRRLATHGPWPKATCKDATDDTLLTLQDDSLNEVVYLLNNNMSDAFSSLQQGLRPPHLLRLQANFSEQGLTMTFAECMVSTAGDF